MLAPWKKSYDKPRQHVKKQRHYFANKGLWYLVKAMVFPVIVCGCESWTTKKPEHRRIDAFELWCWRRFLRVLWTVRRSNQSILKEINPEYSLEGLMLKLRLKYFGHLMQGTDSLEKTLILGKKARGEDGWMPSLNGHEFEQAPCDGEGQGRLVCCSSWGPKESDTLDDNKVGRMTPYGPVRRWWGSHLHQTSLAPGEVVLSKSLAVSRLKCSHLEGEGTGSFQVSSNPNILWSHQ